MDYKHIYLDIDGVLWKSTTAIVKLLNEQQGTSFTGADVTSWNFHEICSNMTDDEVEELFSDKRFFDIVEFVKGAERFLKENRNKITIVTKGTKENGELKRKWFNEHDFEDIPIICLPLDKSKAEVDMSDGLFIDDSTKNLVESNAKYKVMFCEFNDGKNREWMSGWDGIKWYRFY